MMIRQWFGLFFLFGLLLAGLLGCASGQRPPSGAQVEGRWLIKAGPTLNVPHSFFWFSMDVIEFRPDGSLLGLMFWPPGSNEALRLNKTAAYRLLPDGHIEIIGSCRDEDPCSGIYDLSLNNGQLYLSSDSVQMTLSSLGSTSQGSLPTVIGPLPTP